MTTVYLINTSIYNMYNPVDSMEPNRLKDEKSILTVHGEKLAEKLSKYKELKGIDAIYCSQYVRTLATAKYIANENKIDINIDERINEGTDGILGNLDINDLNRMQNKDFDFKIKEGESLNDIKKRMSSFLKEKLSINEDERIVIVSHSKSLIALLSAWCKVGYNYDDNIILSYKGEIILDTELKKPDLYKIEFDKFNIKNISHIEYEKK